jgi:hypothetical protein
MGTSFTKLRLFFHKVSFIINTIFPPLLEMLCAGRLKRFAELSELFTQAAFQLVIFRKSACLECVLQVAKNVEVGGC